MQKHLNTLMLALAATAAMAQDSSIITTFVGGGTASPPADSLALDLKETRGIAVDGSGSLYILRLNDVLRVTRTGAVTRLAGGGSTLSSAVNSAGTNAASVSFSQLTAIAADSTGTVYVADAFSDGARVFRISGGVVTAVGGGGTGLGNGGAFAAKLSSVAGMVAQPDGIVFLTTGDGRVRRISPNASAGQFFAIATVAGILQVSSNGPDGQPGTQTALNNPVSLALDGNSLLIGSLGTCAIRRLNLTTQIVDTLPGTAGLNCGAGFPSLAARNGAVFIGRATLVLQVAGGIVNTFAGLGVAPADGGPAASTAIFSAPLVAADPGADRTYIAQDNRNAAGGGRVRVVTTERVNLSVSRNFGGGDFVPILDGVPLTTPGIVRVTPGIAHSVELPQFVVTATNTRHRFVDFADGGGAATPGGVLPKTNRLIGWAALSTIAGQYIPQHRLTVSVAVPGTGRVSERLGNNPALQIQTEASAFFDSGSTVVLTALPNEGFTFQNFSEPGGTTNSSPFNAIIGNPRTMSATFNATGGFTPIRFNSGGPQFVDSLGQAWAADQPKTNTIGTGEQILGTSDPALYQTARQNLTIAIPAGGSIKNAITYDLAAPNGTYNLRLKFADFTSTAAGQRKFNILVNGSAVLNEFDVFAEAGGRSRAIDKLFSVASQNGKVILSLTAGSAGIPIVNAVQLISGAVGVTVSPASTTLNGGQKRVFVSTVAGSEDRSVVWKIEPAVGSISAEGVYTAPASIEKRQTVTVTAISVADGAKSARAFVQLSPPWTLSSSSGVAFSSQPLDGDGSVIAHVNLDGANANLQAGVMIRAGADAKSQFAFVGLGKDLAALSRFRAIPDGANNTVESGSGMRWVKLTRIGDRFTPYHSLDGVVWAAGPSFGIVMPKGVLAGLAILNGEGDPSESPFFDSAAITGTAAIELSHRFGSLASGQSLQLDAKVTGSSDTSVTWSISPNIGAISASGLYQAPDDATVAPSPVSVIATSNADPSVQARAVFKVGAFEPILVNAGGEAVSSEEEGRFSSDAAFTGGQANRIEAAVEGTELVELYRTSRSSRDLFDYRFTVPNGDYTVRLRFMETEAAQAGRRRFDVRVNGRAVLEQFDISAAAGGVNKPVVRQFAVKGESGELKISFVPTGGEATINAIEILE